MSTRNTHLTGLEGTNPLGFLAAIGVQVLFEGEPNQPKLWWSDDIIPYAIVAGDFTADHIIGQALKIFPLWAESPAIAPNFDGKTEDDIKFSSPEKRRNYLKSSIDEEYASSFATSLIAEDSIDNNGNAKPTDLYFLSGTMKFLKSVKTILTECQDSDLQSALVGPWAYKSKLTSLKWDITDDRQYALSSKNPSNDEKLTNPGVEALAILGVSTHPVFKGILNGKDRTLTTGCSGEWMKGSYTWPIWQYPSGFNAVKSLLYHSTSYSPNNREGWYKAWGISKILQSTIRRGTGDANSYGTFLPPQIIWSSK